MKNFKIKNNELISEIAVVGIMVGSAMLLSWLLGFVAGHSFAALAAVAVVAGVEGLGKHIDGGPVTTEIAEEEAPGLLRSEVDERIVKIRPMSTPLDQISRLGGTRACGSMKVEYYSVDTQPISARLRRKVDGDDANYDVEEDGRNTHALATDNNEIFRETTTIMVPDVITNSGEALVLYVVSIDNNAGAVNVIAVNNGGLMPEIPAQSKLVRMGRAAGELDVMTSQFESLPRKSYNYCQIFKAQVEQSTLMRIANKEVGWTFSDQEEAAIIDMRMGMEKNFLFGSKCRFRDPIKGDEILVTGGIWNQTDNTFTYDASDEANEEWLVSLTRRAFEHSAGSSKKVLLAGSDLIERLHLLGAKRVLVNDAVVTRWGLDFSEIHTKFGTLYVMLSEVFDNCGKSGDGMVIDPEYITKYSHIPFKSENLDLRQSGVRNVDAVVITEASCLVLRYPQSHMKIVATV